MRFRKLASASSSPAASWVREEVEAEAEAEAGGDVLCLLRGEVEGEGAVGSLLGSSKTSVLASLSRKKFMARRSA